MNWDVGTILLWNGRVRWQVVEITTKPRGRGSVKENGRFVYARYLGGSSFRTNLNTVHQILDPDKWTVEWSVEDEFMDYVQEVLKSE